jgi:hypothetical protein
LVHSDGRPQTDETCGRVTRHAERSSRAGVGRHRPVRLAVPGDLHQELTAEPARYNEADRAGRAQVDHDTGHHSGLAGAEAGRGLQVAVGRCARGHGAGGHGRRAALSACTGDSGDSGDSDDSGDSEPSHSGGPLTEIAVDCAQFADTAKKITDAQTALYSGTGGKAAIVGLVTELTALKAGAPSEIQAALTDMSAAFRDAEELLENPTPENKAKLADLSPKLSEDGQKITAYITAECD